MIEDELDFNALKEIIYKTQFLISYCYDNGWFEDNCFTFPDGDTWYGI